MRNILIAVVFGCFSISAFADCKQINNDIEENLKDIAADSSLANSYRMAGYTSKAIGFESKISNSQSQINLLINQANSLKCKPYSGSLNAEKYKNAVKKCGDSVDSSIEEMNFNCDRKNWKPE